MSATSQYRNQSGSGSPARSGPRRDGTAQLSNTCSRIRRPRPGEDMLFHTNTFFSAEMQRVEVPPEARYTECAPPPLRGRRIHESANVRDRRFKQLLDGD